MYHYNYYLLTHSLEITNIELKCNTAYGHVKLHPDYDTVQDFIYEQRGDNEPQERNVDTPPTYVDMRT